VNAAGRGLPRPVREFLHTESASGVLLLIATALALVWANSPWSSSYASVWATPVAIDVGSVWSFHATLGMIVNEGLMALFFFMVGLEIKREIVVGDLRQWRTASLPVICALGGVALPALIYVVINSGHAGSRGWGIPMATDIAFAVGVLTLLGSRVAPSLKLFLLTLAVVDDLVAILVIALFYSGGLHPVPLLVALGLLGLILVLRALQVHWWPVFVAAGFAVWFAVHDAGASPTIAAVVLAFLVPVSPRAEREVVRDWQLDVSDELTAEDVQVLHRFTKSTVSTADRTIHALHPTVSFVIVPLFALANAGVTLDGNVLSSIDAERVAAGTALGLVVGKLVGIAVAGFLAIKVGVARLPRDATWAQFLAVAALGGIGFTVSLFITNLAFTDASLIAAAKLAILIASAAAAALGAAIALLTRGAAS
jgi:NhaA family Na+:H+ antiporter